MAYDVTLHVERLRAAGEPNRLRILALLTQGELAVGELVQIMGQSQPRLSHHLKSLASAGLVERMPEGAWVFYAIPATGEVRDFLDGIISQIDHETGDFAQDLRRLSRVRETRTEAAEAYFSEIADTWDKVRGLHSAHEAIEQYLLELAGSGPFKRILDIGTGTGRILSLFAGRAERLDGVDLSHRMLTVARANLERAGVSGANLRQGDAVKLPYDDGAADLVIVHQVLHFIDEPERVIQEASRIMDETGKLLIVDFAPHTLEFLRSDHGHRRLGIRQSALQEWATKAGLALSKAQSFEQPASLSEGLTVQVWSAEKISVGTNHVEMVQIEERQA